MKMFPWTKSVEKEILTRQFEEWNVGLSLDDSMLEAECFSYHSILEAECFSYHSISNVGLSLHDSMLKAECFLYNSRLEAECFLYNSRMEKEFSSMRSVMEKEFSSMRSVMKKFSWMKSVQMEREYTAMTSLMENEFSKMRSDMENEFSKMRSDMENEVSKKRSEMENEVSKRRSEMKNKFSIIRSVMKKEFSRMRSLRAIWHHKRILSPEEDYKWMKISNGANGHHKKKLRRAIEHHKRKLRFINDAERNDADANGREMTVGKQDIHKNYNGSGHGTKILKSTLSLAPFFLPCAGGTDHGNGPPEHQGHSEIYQFTLDIVSKCPSPGEYMQKSLAKCADVCGSYMQDGNCAYHCMRDSSKTKLVEFCAKPEILFDYCPEFDPVHQTIQKDLATLCNSTFSRNYYNSSDIYFCDPDNCLQLHEFSVRSGATTLMNETTEMNGGDSQEWYIPLLVVAAALIVAILLGYILRVFFKRGFFSARTGKMTKKRYRNRIKYECHARISEV